MMGVGVALLGLSILELALFGVPGVVLATTTGRDVDSMFPQGLEGGLNAVLAVTFHGCRDGTGGNVNMLSELLGGANSGRYELAPVVDCCTGEAPILIIAGCMGGWTATAGADIGAARDGVFMAS